MAIRSVIRNIDYYLPDDTVTSEELGTRWGNWSANRFVAKSGIRARRVSRPDQFASDLAVAAAERLFEKTRLDRRSVDVLVICTQSPDYLLPTTACLVQERLGLSTHCLAFDMNQGCSGYIYALSVIRGLLETEQGEQALLLTADTYTKFIHPDDRSVAPMFGDGAAATLITADTNKQPGGSIGPAVLRTDGSGAPHLIYRDSGCHSMAGREPSIDQADTRHAGHLYMNGPEIFSFALRVVPEVVNEAATRAGLSLDEIDLFLFHQANKFMLEKLREKLGIEPERFVIDLEDIGNTVSSTIPIALKRWLDKTAPQGQTRMMLVGFGVGLSWGAMVVNWRSNPRIAGIKNKNPRTENLSGG